MAKCRCYRKVKPGVTLWCEPECRWVDLQLCYVCQWFDECEGREKAEMEILLAEEQPIKKPRKRLVRRGAV